MRAGTSTGEAPRPDFGGDGRGRGGSPSTGRLRALRCIRAGAAVEAKLSSPRCEAGAETTTAGETLTLARRYRSKITAPAARPSNTTTATQIGNPPPDEPLEAPPEAEAGAAVNPVAGNGAPTHGGFFWAAARRVRPGS